MKSRASSRLQNRDIGLFALMAAATLAAYSPALSGGMVWDDDAHITASALQSLSGLWRIWTELGATQQYYPILHSAFWVEHRLWGDAMLGYHATNVLLHVLAAGLVVAGMRRLAQPGAWLGGFLFALHPVGVESVAWISEQKNTLSAVFYLGSGLAYLRFDRTRKPADYCLALGIFLLALLTKTVTATLPAALLVVFWWQRGRLSWRRDLGPLLPWLALGAAGGIFTAWVEWTLIGAHGAAFTLSLAQRVLIAGRALGFYAGTLLWPANLIFIYPRWTVDPAVLGQWLYPAGTLAAFTGLMALAWRGRRGPLAGALFFAGTLFPVLGAFNVYPFIFSFVADHFQYLARLGVIVPVAVGLTLFAEQRARRWRSTLAALLLGILGVLTWRDSQDYRDADTLNRATLARNPGSWLSHYNLGVSLDHQPGGQAEALAEYRATIAIEPGFADAHNNLAGILLRQNADREGAMAEYRTALRLRPDDAGIHNNLANLLSLAPGRHDEAIAELRMAAKLDPELAEAHFNLANELAKDAGNASDALLEYQSAIRIRPTYAGAYENLGILLAGLPGRLPEAAEALRSALRLQPDNERFQRNLGIVLQRLK